MKSLCIIPVLSLLFTGALSAQITNSWKGGTPGHETDWYYFKNWSLNKVPDAFDRVVIADVSTKTNRYPVISSGVVEVLSVEIHSGASLTLLPGAQLVAEVIYHAGYCSGCELQSRLKDEAPIAASVIRY